jgi:hypothetical protein
MKIVYALAAGLAGAVVLTLTHQALQKLFDDAPRMDLMGEEALQKTAHKMDIDIPKEKSYGITLAGDIVANSLYYALAAIGSPKNALLRSSVLGLAAGAAGAGGVLLPKHIGLTNAYSNRKLSTRLMTMAIYSLGSLVTGKLVTALDKKR